MIEILSVHTQLVLLLFRKHRGSHLLSPWSWGRGGQGDTFWTIVVDGRGVMCHFTAGAGALGLPPCLVMAVSGVARLTFQDGAPWMAESTWSLSSRVFWASSHVCVRKKNKSWCVK